MIKIKRGSTEVKDGKRAEGSWKGVILEDGQPGYDKTTNTLKIGNGSDSWSKLKSLGLNLKQVLDSEKNAKKRLEQDPEDTTVFTYGKGSPTTALSGKVYLHQYEGAVESDYVIEEGVSNGWTFRKWQSGLAECWGRFKIEDVLINTKYLDSSLFYTKGGLVGLPTKYPITFTSTPHELATLSGGTTFITWLGVTKTNTKSAPAKYYLMTGTTMTNQENFYINIDVKGRWKS